MTPAPTTDTAIMQKGTHTMGITLGGRRRTAALAATFALLTGGLAAGIAQGATGSETAATTVPGTVVVKEDAHGKVFTAEASVRNKRDLVAEVQKRRAEHQKAPKAPAPAAPGVAAGDGGGHGDQSGFPVRDQWLNSTKSERISVPGAGQGELVASGSSFVKVPFMEYYAIFTDTSSDVAWLGTRPFNADSIEHTDNWRIGSVGAPFWVVGAPQGRPSGAPAASPRRAGAPACRTTGTASTPMTRSPSTRPARTTTPTSSGSATRSPAPSSSVPPSSP